MDAQAAQQAKGSKMFLLKRYLALKLAAFGTLALLAGLVVAFSIVASTSREAVADNQLLSGVSQIDAGGDHTCALISGAVECWGLGLEGQLGIGGTLPQSCPPYPCSTTPADVCAGGVDPCVTLLSGVTSLATGSDHSCAVMTDTSVKCWGRNHWGALGDGTNTARTTPVDVCEIGATVFPCDATNNLEGVSSVTAGFYHTCAVMTDDSVVCWGLNFTGQLGDAKECGGISCHTPVNVCETGATTFPCDATNNLEGVSAVSSGPAGFHTCALMIDTSVKCWGQNSRGQVGDGACSPCTTPVDTDIVTSGVLEVTAGGFHSCAVMSGGGVKCWGWNAYGEVGDGNNVGTTACPAACVAAPTDVVCGPTPCSGDLTNVSQISAGAWHTCALKTDDTVVCWGWNEYGMLGNGDSSGPEICPELATHGTPPDSTCSTRPVVVSDITAVEQVSAGGPHTCALMMDDTVMCWGSNAIGQLGNGSASGPETCAESTPCSATPVDVVEGLDPGDTDGDGCSDYAEAGPDETIGGQRDPKNKWDFYDVAGPGGVPIPDGVIDLPNDILGVINHQGSAPGPPYDIQYDRGPAAGPSWKDTTGPDGVIDLPNDTLGVIGQHGHSCA